MPRQMESPIPIPCALVVTKGWNSFSPTSFEIPGPVSATATCTSSGLGREIVTDNSRRVDFSISIASAAFFIRLIRTCWIWMRSIRTCGRAGSIETLSLMPRSAALIWPSRIASSTVRAMSSGTMLGPRFSRKARRRRMILPARVACSAILGRIDCSFASPSANSMQALV